MRGVKKILTAVIGVLVVAGAGVGLWFVLDSSAPAATVGKTKITASQINNSVKTIVAERKTVSTTGMQLAFGSALTAEELNYYIISTLLADTAAAQGVTVTDAQGRGQDFSRTTKTGHRATSSLLVLYFLRHEQLPTAPQVGLIINKSVGGSVTRHRIARQLRHAMIDYLPELPTHTQVVIRVLKENSDYRRDLADLISKVNKRSGVGQSGGGE